MPVLLQLAPAFKQLTKRFGDKVRIVFRTFPLTMHQGADVSAEAALAAADQGKFWEYHDAIYQNQTTITQNYQTAAAAGDAAAGLTAAVDGLKGLASQVGLDTAAFNQCLDSGKNTQEVQKDYQDGISYGVEGTPAFFINGVLVSGAQPFANFKTVIDAALQKAGG